MLGCLAALTLSMLSVIEPTEVPQQISLVVAELGGTFTLKCPVLNEGSFTTWFKMSLGNKPQIVAAGVYATQSLREDFNNSRFKITQEESQYVLTIRNLTTEDEATYFCQTGTPYSLHLSASIYLAVKDPNQEKCVYVKQQPKTESVAPGNSVNLQCSLHSKADQNRVQCSGEHSVYWFRAGGVESSPSLIYTQRNRSNEQEETSCGYGLSKTIRDSSDAGIYYCAVVTCGQILFGEGTKVETTNTPQGIGLDPAVLGLLLALLLCCVVIAGLIFYAKRKRICEHCKEAMNVSLHPGHDKPAVDQSTDLHGDAETANYVALDFSAKKMEKGKRRRESPEECVYSAVRAEYHTQH